MAPGSKSAKKSKTPGPQGQNKANIMKRKAFSEGGPTAKNSKNFGKSDIKNTKAKTPQKTELAPPEKMKLTFSESDSKMKQTPAKVNGKKMKTPKSSGKHTGIDELVVSNTPKGKGFTGTPKSFGKKAMTPKSSGKSKESRVDDLVEAKMAPVTPKGKGFTPKKAMSEGAKMKRPQISQNVDRKVPQSAGGQSKKQAKGVKKEDLSQVKLPFGLEDDYDDEDEDEDFDMDEDVSDDSGSDADDSDDIDSDDIDEDGDEEDSEGDSDENEAIIDDDDEDESSASDEEITFKPSASSSTKKPKTPKVDVPGTKTSEETKKPSKTPKSALKTPGTGKSTNKKVSIMLTSPENEKPSSKKVVTTPHPSLSRKRRPDDNTEIKSGSTGQSSSKKKTTNEDSSSESDEDAQVVMQELSFGDDDDEDDEDYEEEEDSGDDDSEGEDDVEEEDSEDDDSEGLEEDEEYQNMKGLSKDLKAVMESLSFEEADDDDEDEEEDDDDEEDDEEEEDFDEEPEDEDVDSDDEDLDDDSDEGGIEAAGEEGTVKSQTGKRKLKTSEKDGKPPKKKVKQAEEDTKKLKEDDRYYYHVGNLPPNATKNSLRWFLAESDILVKPENVYVKNEQLTRVKGHHGKKVNKEKMHRYAVISLSSKAAAQKLHELNGIEYPATSGKWRDYELAIYPLSHGPKQKKAVSENQFTVHISNLNYNTTDEDLKDLFMKRGMRPTRVWIVRRGLKQVSRGFGFARLRTRNEQLKATKINGIELDDFKLKISKAKIKNEDSDKQMHAYPYFIGSNLDAKDEKKKAKKIRKNKVKPRKYQKRNKKEQFSKQTSENPEEGSPKPEASSEKMNSPENKVPNGELKRKSNKQINQLRPTFGGKRAPHPKQGTPKPESGSENMNSLDKKGPSGDLKGKPKGPRPNFKGKQNRNFDEKKAKPRKKKWLKGPPSKKSTTEQV